MNRPLIAIAALAAVTVAHITSPAQAGCKRGHHPHHHSHHVRHVHRVVHPVAHYHRHVAPPVIHPVTVVRPAVQVVPPPIIAPPEPVLPTVPAGATLTIPANFLGDVAGSVFMVFQDIKLPVQVNAWNISGVTITLPPMAIRDAVVVRLDVVLADGRLGHSQKLNVTAPPPVILHPGGPTSAPPTHAALSGQPNLFGGEIGN